MFFNICIYFFFKIRIIIQNTNYLVFQIYFNYYKSISNFIKWIYYKQWCTSHLKFFIYVIKFNIDRISRGLEKNSNQFIRTQLTYVPTQNNKWIFRSTDLFNQRFTFISIIPIPGNIDVTSYKASFFHHVSWIKLLHSP